jgi:hypothetical protein
MPEDVRIGYIALDSVRRGITEKEFIAFLGRQYDNDTIAYLMKYLYKVVDYNPILFELTSYVASKRTSVGLSTIKYHIENFVRANSPKRYLEKLLIKSSIIAHVFVEDTLNLIDSGAHLQIASIVTCSIRDTIKGKVLPKAKVISINPLENATDESDTLPSNYLQFSYRTEWRRVPENEVISDDVSGTIVDDDGKVLYPPRMMDSTGSGWVKKGKEYIVFLRFQSVCHDSSYIYLTLFPFLTYSATCNVYPIENGYVIDPVNELGFGKSVEVNLFKNLLKQRINEIINFGE